ncbi:uncharacterized protein [Prorops nasuta]|uniref:uncharacterized protein n=1 Tax=Prorops nasuta TaxID=863751 RepID=UPI0034CF76FB
MPTELGATVEINSTYPDGMPGTGAIVVRSEEVLIVVFVLVLWVAAIALFFNRWGKIRMLEPYQPKFQQQHRQSCAIVDPTPLPHRTYSKFNIHCLEHPLHQVSCTSGGFPRPRQNSVFVGSSSSLLPASQESPRRTKSAFDLQSLAKTEYNVLANERETENENYIEPEIEEDVLRSLRPVKETTRLIQRDRRRSFCQFERSETPTCRQIQKERGMSVCHFEKTDVLGRPLMRDRGMSICQFDRMDVLARPLLTNRGSSPSHFDRTDVLARPPQKDRGNSLCTFDRMDVLARPTLLGNRSLLRERRTSFCNFLGRDEELGIIQVDRRKSVSNLDRIETAGRSLNKETSVNFTGERKERSGSNAIHFDRPTCSKASDVVLGYKATCV